MIRNRRAHARSEALDEEIRAILTSHDPLAPPITAKAVQVLLKCSPLPEVRTVQWHIHRIRCAQRNSQPEVKPLHVTAYVDP